MRVHCIIVPPIMIVELLCRACEIEHPTSSDHDMTTSPHSIALSKWDCMGVAMACFVFARCLQLGNAVEKNEDKARAYYEKVLHNIVIAAGGTEDKGIEKGSSFSYTYILPIIRTTSSQWTQWLVLLEVSLYTIY